MASMEAMREEHARTNRIVTRQGNVGNYDKTDAPNTRIRVDKTKFKVENMAQRPTETFTSIWDHNDEEGTNDMLHFFGYRKSPEPSESNNRTTMLRQPKVKYLFMPKEKVPKRPVVEDWYDRGNRNDDNAVESAIGQRRRGWPRHGMRDEEPDVPPREEMRWLNGHDSRAFRMIPIDDYLIDFRRDDNNFDMGRISKLFDIDFGAFNKNYVPPETTSRYGKNKKRFVLRNRQDIKDLMEHILSMNNLQEPQMLFDVETSAHMISATLLNTSRKSVILRIIKALLNNDTNEVFKLIECNQGYEGNEDTQGAGGVTDNASAPRNEGRQ